MNKEGIIESGHIAIQDIAPISWKQLQSIFSLYDVEVLTMATLTKEDIVPPDDLQKAETVIKQLAANFRDETCLDETKKHFGVWLMSYYTRDVVERFPYLAIIGEKVDFLTHLFPQ